MIESPLLQEMRAEAMQKTILKFLTKRFGKVPRDVRRLLAENKDEEKLMGLAGDAAECSTVEEFKDRLLA